MAIEFMIPGAPVPKGRPRVTAHGTYTPAKTREYEKRVLECWQKQSAKTIPEGVPIRITVVARFEIPKSWSKKRRTAALGAPHTSRPDLDNIVKSITDALNGAAFPDDSAIAVINAYKTYGDTPCVFVAIKEADVNDSQDNA